MKFSTTYTIYAPWAEGEDQPEVLEQGYLTENGSLTDCLQDCGDIIGGSFVRGQAEPSEWPADHSRFVTFTDVNEGTREWFEDGVRRDVFLNFPENITPSSRIRVLRLIGVNV